MEPSEKIATKPVAESQAAAGQMVDLGSHRLYYRVSGAGSPTVVIEAGAGGTTGLYSLLEEGIAKFTRVLVYDRAGLGQSEPSNQALDANEVARQLYSLFQKAALPGPYLLVGHSLGGLYIRKFTEQYPNEVAGLVFLDASHPEQAQRLPAIIRFQTNTIFKLITVPGLGTVLAKLLYKNIGKDTKSLPANRQEELKAQVASPIHMKAVVAEYKNLNVIMEQTRATPSLENRPVAVFSATLPKGTFIRGWHQLQSEIAALSTNSTHTKVEGAKHITLVTHPPYVHLIVETIHQMVLKIRETIPNK